MTAVRAWTGAVLMLTACVLEAISDGAAALSLHVIGDQR